MKNKSLKKLTALLLSAVLLLALSALPAMADGENLLAEAGLDPSFEAETRPKAVSLSGNAAVISATAHEGSQSVSLPTKDSALLIRPEVEAAKNYTFSFWMKNSVAGSLQMHSASNRFTVNGVTFAKLNDNDPNSLFDWYTSGHGLLGTYTFGALREGEDIDVWRKVSINFTTPYEACNGVNFLLSAAQDDEWLVVDDFCLIETGKAPNRVFGGDFEDLDLSGDVIKPATVGARNDSWGGDYLKIEEDETGNHFVHLYRNMSAVVAPEANTTSLCMKGSSLGTRYKVSFRFKSDGTNPPTMRLYDKNNSYYNAISQFPAATVGEWETYTLYINGTPAANDGVDIVKNIWFNNSTKREIYLDDLYSWYDADSLGFYKELALYEKDGSRYFSGLDETYTKNVLTSEKSVEAKSLDDIEATEGRKTVTARAHFLPKQKPDNSFDAQTVTLITAAYKYENGKKMLTDVAFSSATSAAGETVDAVGTVSVPADGGDYKVQAMAWDMASMKLIAKKAVLE